MFLEYASDFLSLKLENIEIGFGWVRLIAFLSKFTNNMHKHTLNFEWPLCYHGGSELHRYSNNNDNVLVVRDCNDSGCDYEWL